LKGGIVESENALVVQQFMPALTVADVIARRNVMVDFVKATLKEHTDYGVIQGTNKPTLLKPGAEKLCTLFGLTVRFSVIESEKDWLGAQHNGEPFFYFSYRAQLYRGDTLIAESDGSCSSMEKKYRWRNSERKCPNCGKHTIIKGKQDYGGGWLCFAKKGGCNSKFADDAPAIIEQPVGQVLNPDIADQVNTIQKMAQKRALIGATLLAVNASEFFTQDIEDMTIDGSYEVVGSGKPNGASDESVPVKEVSVSDNNRGKKILDRGDLIQKIAGVISYYGHAKHVVAMLVAEEKAGNVKAEMSDKEIFEYANQYAGRRANEKAQATQAQL
jgi:hypothetical protein